MMKNRISVFSVFLKVSLSLIFGHNIALASEFPKEKITETIREGYVNEITADEIRQARPSLNARHRDEFRWFEIFNVDVLLYGDPDANGYFSSFDLSFDMDVEYGFAEVFAEIWIRPHGGYYEHLHTTEIFAIEGQNAIDEYLVSTDLISDYPSDYYDILIELYDIDHSTVKPVAVANSHEHESLHDLPLESRHDHHHGGSLTITASGSGAAAYALPILALLSLMRWRKLRTFRQP